MRVPVYRLGIIAVLIHYVVGRDSAFGLAVADTIGVVAIAGGACCVGGAFQPVETVVAVVGCPGAAGIS
ncbi:MAG: hypothetical protein P8163_19235 [Candidatus Thiodiazotropha sp.]